MATCWPLSWELRGDIRWDTSCLPSSNCHELEGAALGSQAAWASGERPPAFLPPHPGAWASPSCPLSGGHGKPLGAVRLVLRRKCEADLQDHFPVHSLRPTPPLVVRSGCVGGCGAGGKVLTGILGLHSSPSSSAGSSVAPGKSLLFWGVSLLICNIKGTSSGFWSSFCCCHARRTCKRWCAK